MKKYGPILWVALLALFMGFLIGGCTFTPQTKASTPVEVSTTRAELPVILPVVIVTEQSRSCCPVMQPSPCSQLFMRRFTLPDDVDAYTPPPYPPSALPAIEEIKPVPMPPAELKREDLGVKDLQEEFDQAFEELEAIDPSPEEFETAPDPERVLPLRPEEVWRRWLA